MVCKDGRIQFDYNGPVAMTITDDSSEETRQTLYYISNGRVDTGFTGLAQATLNGEDGWFYFQNGMWDQYPDTSLAEYGGSWWYIADGGKIDFNYNGTAYFNDVEWYVEGGRVDFSFTGRAEGDQVVADGMEVPFQTYFVNGMQQMDLTGVYYTEVKGNYGWYGFYKGQLANRDWYYGPTIGYVLSNASGWWYINPETGLVDFNYTGMAENDYGIWYMNNGQIDFGYNGFVKQRPYKLDFGYDYYDLYAVTGGKADCNYDGILWTTIDGVSGWYGFYKGELATTAPSEVANLLPNEAGWWCIDMLTGQVDFSKNGFKSVRDENGTGHLWYVRDGQVDFSLNGAYIYPDHVIPAEKYCWLVGGQIDKTCSGVYYMNLDGIEGWYGFLEGQQITYTLLPNPDDGSWWYVSTNGQIDFSRTGIVRARDHYYHLAEDAWYVRNGQVDFSYTGLVYGDEKCYLVQDGRSTEGNNSLAYLTLNGETAWWQVTDGCITPGKTKI